MRSRRALAAVLAAALAVTSCSAVSTSAGTTGATSSASSATSSMGSSTTTSSSDATSSTAAFADAVSASLSDVTHYDSDDLTWDAGEEVAVTLTDGASSIAAGVTVDGNTVTITAAGTYRLTGNLTDGQLVVAAGEEDVVRVILDGVSLSSSTGSPFVVQSADEVLVYLDEGSANTLSDAASYADQADGAAEAAMFSMADLTIAGSGSLTVNGNFADGIVSKDGLVLVSGNVTVNAVDDGIRGTDYVVLLDGSYAVTAGGDGVKSDNEEDADRGWLQVDGGTLTVTAGDDAVKAFNSVTINAGTVTVAQSAEGIEAQHITIAGGTVTVTSSDDALNASGGTGSSGGMGGGEAAGDYTLVVSGGTVTLTSDGDGLDSNGSATITGGTMVVNGPTDDGNGALDVNGEFLVDGGTVAAAGSAGMAVTPSTSSAQSAVQVTFGSAVEAGTAVSVADSSGTLIATFVPAKATASLVFSSPAIVAGEQYTVYTGGTADIAAGLGTATLDGASAVGTVTAGSYSAARGPGGGARPGR